ncbi:glycosyltransferase family 4 protein [Pacificimonas flava]|uniref:Glycosyl transferase family 1 domain-containing protein n=1 Tax=Pacificimonas flava TaxID=1234595 RepID=M2TJX7_9SPHN|nr:glycosyltransferase family 1 protein [Pacificimonas flava]EMD81966.1 hypothetical protein C725_2622 [Pacificimonas flava]MBB5280470.1 glycosyltransferase involved in cell wall biosynthesis [Pacificimonas flava]
MARRRFYLDLSRLLSRVRHSAPTGVDRVEMSYARRLPDLAGGDFGYCARHPSGAFGRLADQDVARFLDETQERWHGRAGGGDRGALASLARIRPRAPDGGKTAALILASPANLHRPRRIAHMKNRLNATLTALVHDLIPVTHPEYARPGGAEKHARRIETLRREAFAVIANSTATAEGLARHWSGWPAPAIAIAPLGIDALPCAESARRDRPYFLMVGTIEPRKNHLLLLHVWRKMAEERRDAEIPELLLVGRRGWENEQVVDLLERAPGIQPHVRELGALPERELAALYRGAHALLMPSFSEGFGLPVAEALSVGTPVLASDIPAHREVAGAAARYLSPLDGEGWMAAIRDTASGPRGKPAADWQSPGWDRHLDIVLAAAEKSLP